MVTLQEGGDLCSQGIIQVRRDLWRSSNPASSPSMSKRLRLCKDFFSETWICPGIAIPQLDTKALEFDPFFLDVSICDLYKAVNSWAEWNLLDWRDMGLWLSVPGPSLKQTSICWVGWNSVVLKVLFNSNHSVINVWKLKKIAFKFEQHYMIFFLAWLCCWCWTLSLHSFPTHRWLLLVGMWQMATATEKLPFVCWCFHWAGGLGWQILQQPCLVWTSTNKTKPITAYFLQCWEETALYNKVY